MKATFAEKIKSKDSVILKELHNHIFYFLETSNIFTRKSWASILRVSEAALSQWSKGISLMRPKYLNNLFNTIYTNFNTEETKYYINSFLKIVDLPLNKFEKKTLKNQNTIGDYMLLSGLDEFNSNFSKLPYLVKKELMLIILRLTKNTIGELNSSFDNLTEVINTLRKLEFDLTNENQRQTIDKLKFERNNEINLINQGKKQLHIDPVNKVLDELSIFNALREIIKNDDEFDKTISESSKYILPIDKHIVQFKNIDDEIELFNQIVKHFDKIDLIEANSMLTKLIEGFKENKLSDLNPGLLISLVQILIYKNYKHSDINVETWISTRSKFLSMYKECYFKNLFNKNDISKLFFKRIIDISLSLNDYDFVEELIKFYDQTIKESKDDIFYNYASINYYTHKIGNFKNIDKSVERHLDNNIINKYYEFSFISTDILFLHLRYYWAYNNLTLFLQTYDNLVDSIWEKSISPSIEQKVNNKRLQWYWELNQENKNESILKSFVKDKYEDLDLLEDNRWLLAINKRGLFYKIEK